jgi:hypothetical protein
MREARALSSSRGATAGGGGGAATGAQLVVLLDQPSELRLDHIQEGVYLVLVIPALADRGLFEHDVVHVGRRQWHRGHLRSDGGNGAISDGQRDRVAVCAPERGSVVTRQPLVDW